MLLKSVEVDQYTGRSQPVIAWVAFVSSQPLPPERWSPIKTAVRLHCILGVATVPAGHLYKCARRLPHELLRSSECLPWTPLAVDSSVLSTCTTLSFISHSPLDDHDV